MSPTMQPIRSARPCYTVAICTYQRPTLLAKAVQSVCAQSFTDIEVIIVDDASADDTPQMIQSLRAPNLRAFRQETNRGIGAARNVALREARGEFILFMDDDDRLTPDFLQQLYQAWQHLPATVSFIQPKRHYIRLSADGSEHFIREMSYGASSVEVRSGHAYLQRPFGSGSGLVVRVADAHAVGEFNTERVFAEDSDYMLRLALQGDMAIIPEALYLAYSHNKAQVTTDHTWLGAARERLADSHRHTLRRYPKTLRQHYVGAARTYYARKKRNAGRRCLAKALRLVPYSRNTWWLLLLLELNQFLPEKMSQDLFYDPRHGDQRL